jgi:hypothetical protein
VDDAGRLYVMTTGLHAPRLAAGSLASGEPRGRDPSVAGRGFMPRPRRGGREADEIGRPSEGGTRNGSPSELTYEAGENPDEYIHGIFSADGISVGRKRIGISGMMGRSLNAALPVCRNNRYYRLKYKENRYMELMVYKLVWGDRTQDGA